MHQSPSRLVQYVLLSLLVLSLFALYFVFPRRYQEHEPVSVLVREPAEQEKKIYGMIICAGEGETFSELLTMVEQTRYQMKSELPIAIMHCDELSVESVAIATSITDVEVINLCSPRHPQYRAQKPRFKGFFCKPLALHQSPFRHTILVDTDVVFFQKPEKLFQAAQYLSTGALFFRDRCFTSQSRQSLTFGTGTAENAYNYLNVGAEILRKLHKEGRLTHAPIEVNLSPTNLSLTNSFWRHFATQKSFTPDHWQVTHAFHVHIYFTFDHSQLFMIEYVHEIFRIIITLSLVSAPAPLQQTLPLFPIISTSLITSLNCLHYK